jgi:hypothetical protein
MPATLNPTNGTADDLIDSDARDRLFGNFEDLLAHYVPTLKSH